jgi:hypothetical protein
MAALENRTADVHFEDVVGLKSRISWGAVFAGSVVALAVYLVLTLFFAALGLSLSDAGVRANNIGWGALVAAVVSMAVSLLAGGCVTTQLTAGETRAEAVIHGVLTWAVVSFLSLMLVGYGMKAGYNALVGAAYAAGDAADRTGQSWEDLARRAGVSQQQIDQWKAQADPERAKAAAQDPANQQAARTAAVNTAWITLAGTLLAMGAAIAGAIAGSGPRFRFIPVTVRATDRPESVLTR